MFIGGFLVVDLAIAMAVGAFLVPEAAAGLAGGAIGVGLAGALMMYLGWPSRSKPAKEGMVKADAFLVEAKGAETEAVGYRMVELTLDVRPKGGVPFQVTRKFVADRPSYEAGQKFEVHYDPADPEKLDLV